MITILCRILLGIILALSGYTVAVTWDSQTVISGTITDNVTILAGTTNQLAGDTMIKADGVERTVTINGSVALGASNNETLSFKAMNGGRIRLQFTTNARFNLFGNMVARIPQGVTIDLGDNGILSASNTVKILSSLVDLDS